MLTGWWRALGDLVLPATCAGCDRGGAGSCCGDCGAALVSLAPSAARPTPAPPGLPGCVALGPYDGVLRGLLLGYKERGAHPLGRPLGAGLAVAIRAVVGDARRPVVVVAIPSTPAAVRERHGDHMARLAREAVRQMRIAGLEAAVAPALAARPKSDSSHLDVAGRARAARDAFRVRAHWTDRLVTAQRAGAAVVLVDDIVTTGATLASAASALAAAGVRVTGVATLAATQRRVALPIR